MISSYRLGDLVMLDLDHIEIDAILNDHPNTIGSKYILEKRNNPSKSNIEIFTKIVLEHVEYYKDLLPKDISDSTLIHLRLGDVIAGTTDHEMSKRPLEIEDMKTLLTNDSNKRYVIGKCFFAISSSRNYEECIQLSNNYLHNVINELNAEYFDSGNADIDLCCAIQSKLFLQGKGFFSKLIVEIRKTLNLDNIELSG